jgi:hypothetical protein
MLGNVPQQDIQGISLKKPFGPPPGAKIAFKLPAIAKARKKAGDQTAQGIREI